MDQVSKPLLALLVGTVLFFALWLVALKPGQGSTPSGPHGLGQYQSAVSAAQNAVAQSNRVSPQQGNLTAGQATTAAATPATSTTATRVTTKPATSRATPTSSTAASKPAGAKRRLDLVTRALERRRVVALLFYNPAGADDRAVATELRAIPIAHHRVVKLAVPVGELSHYPVVTNQVPITGSPTLVLIDARHQATSLLGYASQFELAQRITDALAIRALP